MGSELGFGAAGRSLCFVDSFLGTAIFSLMLVGAFGVPFDGAGAVGCGAGTAGAASMGLLPPPAVASAAFFRLKASIAASRTGSTVGLSATGALAGLLAPALFACSCCCCKPMQRFRTKLAF